MPLDTPRTHEFLTTRVIARVENARTVTIFIR